MQDAPSEAPPTQRDRQNALRQIRYASVIDPDLTPSEDETPDERELQLEDAQSAIGVSIGEQQRHLVSPKTPAAEKAAALDEASENGFFDGWQQSLDGTVEQSAPSRAQDATATKSPSDRESLQMQTPTSGISQPDPPPLQLPSPWRSGPRGFMQVDDHHRAALRDSLAKGSRRRALSGGGTIKKYIPFNLPSMPKPSSLLNFSLPTFSVSSLDTQRNRQMGTVPSNRRVTYSSSPSSRIPQHDGSDVSKLQVGPSNSAFRSPRAATDPPQNASVPYLQKSPPSQLRRSNSEGSLMLYRSKSFASSLGDDSRFDNVQEQVNSRLKAIKDSWQDANFRLPSLPSMPNFNFASREDLFKNRSGGLSPREPSVNSSLNPGSSSRSASTRLRMKESGSGVAGMTAANAMAHPFFTRAVQDLTGDLVILGGYRGSILRSAEPPHRQLWVPFKVGLNLRKVDLELGLNPADEETETERIIPAGMLTHIGPVDIAKRLFKRLRSSDNARNGKLRVHNYGYDWRLSPHILSRKLIEYLRTLPCNQPGTPPEKSGAIVIAHSLGGLITRHAINQCPELVAGVIYAGVPKTCVNILGPFRNGDDVLLSSRVLTAQVNFTIRTSFALLPLDGKCFFNKHTKEEYPIDFFDVKTWTEYCLSPCVAPPLPIQSSASSLLSASGLLNAVSQALPSIPSRKSSVSKGGSNGSVQSSPAIPSTSTIAPQNSSHPVRYAAQDAENAADKVVEGRAQTTGVTPQMTNSAYRTRPGQDYANNPATAVTIPHDKAMEYLTRTLAEVKKFKQELSFRPEYAESNRYPPIALIYGKSTPTVFGAKVESKEAIKRVDAYDELAFASGDGVVLARAAMVPSGYSVVKGGVVSSERGHVTLLGDLEAVGRCLAAVMGARRMGLGVGREGAEGR
ncbi:hypothetical protein CC78DRAFT_71384 [Lojkania enalia]|uniref:Uncharacterized protein n=1 Tax=Lojkania enalia TaxID=147567 RepID=A0A9P4MYJ2_9PLEO|nr:hypothetical protein CC78DRAFT_71384 [Didymosphaeria enalia]